MKRYIAIFAAVYAVLMIAGYMGGVFTFSKQSHHAEAEHNHSADPHAGHDHGAGKGIHLTSEQRKHVKIVHSRVQSGMMNQRLELHGEVKLNADRTSRIMQRVPGFVTAVYAKQGDRVKKGDVLARLNSEKLGEHYSAYYSGKAIESVAASEFRMAEKLFANKAMSEKEYLRYKKEYIDAGINRRKAEIILRSLELDLKHSGHKHGKDGKDVICTEYDIVSPISGTVVTRDISLGEKYADDNTQVLFLVSDLDRLWVELRADYQELRSIKPGASVEITPLGSKNEKFAGVVTYVSSVIDEVSRKGVVRVELDSKANQLRSGEFAMGSIKLESSSECIIIPREAVQLVSGETVVFVPAKGNYITRVVRTGRADGKYVEIISGLTKGEEYVSVGAFELKAILLTAGMDPHAGHGH